MILVRLGSYEVPNARSFVTGLRLTVSLPLPILDLHPAPEMRNPSPRRRADVDRAGRHDQALRWPSGGQRHLAGGGGWRAVRAAGVLGERQEHAAAHDRRP